MKFVDRLIEAGALVVLFAVLGLAIIYAQAADAWDKHWRLRVIARNVGRFFV